jgi:branched-chain amino acid transport system ATP-binding protein
MANLGVGRTFQVPRVFNELSVRENMLVPTIPRPMTSKEAEGRSNELLELVGLLPLLDRPAVELSGGQKKLLEFARVLMTDPGLILLDEPFAGVAPSLAERLVEVALRLNQQDGRSFFLISHDIPCITRLCHTVFALAAGKLIARGSPDKVRCQPEVIEAYLGH